MKIGIGNDHAAVDMKNEISEYLKEKGYEVVNYGTDSNESCDYPVYGEKVGEAVAHGDVDLGILICGTGVGISLAANKVEGIRAVVCSEPYTAKLSRQHNNTNILAFGARVIGIETAKMIVDEWLNAEFMGGKHERRVNMLMDIEYISLIVSEETVGLFSISDIVAYSDIEWIKKDMVNMAYSIMMDAGHGGRDPGAVYNGRQEKDDTLRLALAVGENLQNNGIDVEYTRTTDVYETPYEKAMEANEAGVDLFISIHRNSFPSDNTAFGVESLVYDLSGLKYEIAESVNQQLEAVGFRNLGVKARPNLVVLKRTKMPAVLIEVGFINSDVDNRLFDENFNDIALAISDGILDVLRDNSLIPESETDPGSDTEHAPDMKPEPEYRIQAGAFRNRMYAERLLGELLEQDYPAYIDDSGAYARVQVGRYTDMNQAVAMERRLKRDGYQTVLLKQ